MDLHSIRQTLRTKTVYDIPLRVTYYARVSSESNEQLNSLGSQISYYEDFIRRNPAWEFCGPTLRKYIEFEFVLIERYSKEVAYVDRCNV